MGLALYIPPAGVAGIMHLHFPLCVIRRVQQLIHEFLHHIFRKPCCSKSNRNLTCGQIRRLNFFQKPSHSLRILDRFQPIFEPPPVFTHIARKVLICGKVISLDCRSPHKAGSENNAAEVSKEISSSVFPVSCIIYGISTFAFSPIETARASEAGINAGNLRMLPDRCAC